MSIRLEPEKLVVTSNRQLWRSNAGIAKLGATTARILADTHNIEHSLRQHVSVLYVAHKRICAVTKGPEKPVA